MFSLIFPPLENVIYILLQTDCQIMGTTPESSANMTAEAASHPRPRYIRDVWWSRKADGNVLVH
jgi:hypothetical protein